MNVETVPQTPEEITTDFLTNVISKAYEKSTIAVKSFQTVVNPRGILSKVIHLTVEYDQVCDLPCHFILKFYRPILGNKEMFRVESEFYSTLGDQGHQHGFRIPKYVHASTEMIMVEYIPKAMTYDSMDGCPQDKVLQIVQNLAFFHSKYFSYDCSKLAPRAGIGSAVDGTAKETQFPGLWKEFVDGIESNLRPKIISICQKLSHCQLGRIDDQVHSKPFTLIHGDFHLANLLFSPSDPQQMWLVDWQTCGYGCPLRDLAFFMIVSMNPQDRATVEKQCLDMYHSTLIENGINVFTREECQKLYEICILNQFIILVMYNTFTKNMIASMEKGMPVSTTTGKEEHLTKPSLEKYFHLVNLRCCEALLDNFQEHHLPPQKTHQQQEKQNNLNVVL